LPNNGIDGIPDTEEVYIDYNEPPTLTAEDVIDEMQTGDVELEFEIENEEQLHKILLDLRNKFSDIIRDYDSLLVHTEHKLNSYPF